MGVRGLGGDLRLLPLSDDPDRLALGASVIVDGERAPRRITAVSQSRHGPVVRLEGIADRDAAAALIGLHLSAEGAPAELPADHYWWHQLEGLEVVDRNGEAVGRLVEVFRAGGNEVYRVSGEQQDVLVPALRSVVLDIDLGAGRMTILPVVEWLEEV
jgi:16S rRNA processing protein RimM